MDVSGNSRRRSSGFKRLRKSLEAFRVPSLRREVERARLQAEEDRLAYRHLEETLHEERLKQAAAIEEERKRFRAEITDLIEQHRAQITQLNHEHSQTQHLLSEAEKCKRQLQKDYEDQLRSLKVEFNKLQRTHEESLDILREENDSIREQIDENKMVIEGLMHYKHESHKLKSEYEAKEKKYKEQLQCANEEIERLKAEKQEFLCAGQDGQNTSVQEVQSLRAVLELKQVEVSELRKNLAEALQRADLLPTVEEKVSTLTARCEDLQLQLERKNVYEQQILQDKKKLEESFKEENNQKKRLLQYNEELQWRLKQNKEVVSHVLEQAEEGTFNRSLLTFSFNERHNSTAKSNLERALSFRERALSNKSNCSTDSFNESKSKATFDFLCDKVSPPSSPKVKGVVEKSDSVSYVLDLDESPEVVASRIVRRSFRNSTPPKNTPTKSPANKRPRMKNPLSLSASASAIVPSRIDRVRSRSANVRNPDYDQAENVFVWPSAATSTPREPKFSEVDIANFDLNNGKAKLDENLDLEDEDDDIDIPGLPSEIGRKNSAEELPAPHQLAGESMIFESNSEDESTSSSSVQL